MAMFRFRAASSAGAIQIGEIDASDRAAAALRLQSQGLVPIRIEPFVATAPAGGAAQGRRWFASRKITEDQLGAFTRELATLLAARIPLDRALEILLGLADSLPLREMIVRVRDDVRGGLALTAALERQGKVFSRFYVSMVRAGEAGGALAAVLARIAEFLERSKDLRETVKSALVYPTILVSVALISVFTLLTLVVPQFSQMFKESGKDLPLATEIVIGAGNWLRAYWWTLLLAAAVAPRAWRWYLASPARRYRWDLRKLRSPVLGDLLNKIETARFARTLGTLLRNGVPLLSGLAIVRGIAGNTVIARAIDVLRERLQEGKGLGRPMLEQRVFPPLAVHMVMVGEETGSLDEMLHKVADVYDREVQYAVKRMLSLLEPVMILGLGLVIGGIIMSILLAILRVNSLVG